MFEISFRIKKKVDTQGILLRIIYYGYGISKTMFARYFIPMLSIFKRIFPDLNINI